jgi:4-hydroxyacetophenone monooxygenase
VPDPMRWLLRTVPLYRLWYRMRLLWTFNDKLYTSLQRDPEWPHPERSLNRKNDRHREFLTRYITDELGDRQDLLPTVLPTYPPYGKRILFDNGWFRALRRDDVTLDGSGVAEVRPHSVVSGDGVEYDVDVLVAATGFDVVRFLSSLEIVGRSGRSIREIWDDDDAKAYLGTVVPDLPNFFCLYGPNLQPGHGGSFIVTVEQQTRYVRLVLEEMFRRGLGSVECRQDVYDEYNERVDATHAQMVWTHPGMTTYYRNQRGRIIVNSPWRNVDFFGFTREPSLDDFVVEARREESADVA